MVMVRTVTMSCAGYALVVMSHVDTITFDFSTSWIYEWLLHSPWAMTTCTVRALVFRHLWALRKSPWKFIIWMNELSLHCMLLVFYIQQYFNTTITVLTNQAWKLLIALLTVTKCTNALHILLSTSRLRVLGSLFRTVSTQICYHAIWTGLIVSG